MFDNIVFVTIDAESPEGRVDEDLKEKALDVFAEKVAEDAS